MYELTKEELLLLAGSSQEANMIIKDKFPQLFEPMKLTGIVAVSGKIPALAMGEGLSTRILVQLYEAGSSDDLSGRALAIPRAGKKIVTKETKDHLLISFL